MTLPVANSRPTMREADTLPTEPTRHGRLPMHSMYMKSYIYNKFKAYCSKKIMLVVLPYTLHVILVTSLVGVRWVSKQYLCIDDNDNKLDSIIE